MFFSQRSSIRKDFRMIKRKKKGETRSYISFFGKSRSEQSQTSSLGHETERTDGWEPDLTKETK